MTTSPTPLARILAAGPAVRALTAPRPDAVVGPHPAQPRPQHTQKDPFQ